MIQSNRLARVAEGDGGYAKVAALAKRTGTPVPDNDARLMYSEYACACGNNDACAAK